MVDAHPETAVPIGPGYAIWPFLLIAFGLAWGLVAALILFTDTITQLFGEVSATHPLFILAVYSPAIAAFAIVSWYGGWRGLKRFLSRLLLWRVSLGWYAVVILVIPVIFMAGSLIKGNLFTAPLPFTSFSAALSAMAFMLILGPIEEFGWRGLALPLLQRRLAPIWAGLVLGAIWAVWHVPAFFLGGTPQSAWGIMPFLIGSVAVSLILTALFNASRGSILLAALFHFQLNNPLWPDAQPYDTVFFVFAAAIVVWVQRDTMFARDQAITRVIPAP